MRIQSLNTQYEYNKLGAQANEGSFKNSTLEKQNNVSFEGKFGDKIGEIYGKYYAEKMLNQKWLRNSSSKLAGASNLMTQHMATLGSLLTSSVYFYQTVTNKKLDPEKRTTLGINQIGCFIIPTICAYAVDYKLRGFNKKMEYEYSGLMRHKMATGQMSEAEVAKLTKSFGTKLKGFGAFMGLATFTLIYRYLTPVAITPAANKIGDWYNAKKKEENKNVKEKAIA